MGLWISRSFNHRNLRTFEFRESEVATQKLTKLCNNPQHRVSRIARTFSAPLSLSLCLSLSIIITSYYYSAPSFITPNLLEDHPPIVLFCCILWRDERLGENPHFLAWDSRGSTTTEKRTALFIWRSIATQNSPSSPHSLVPFSRFIFSRYRVFILLLLLNSFFL